MRTMAWVGEDNSQAAAALRWVCGHHRTSTPCRPTAVSSPLRDGGGNDDDRGEGVHNSVSNDGCYCAPVVRVRERKEKQPKNGKERFLLRWSLSQVLFPANRQWKMTRMPLLILLPQREIINTTFSPLIIPSFSFHIVLQIFSLNNNRFHNI